MTFSNFQINLKIEADNMEKFSENFSDIPFIKFPRPLRPFVTTKVGARGCVHSFNVKHYLGGSQRTASDKVVVSQELPTIVYKASLVISLG